MNFIPTKQNDDYQGSKISIVILALFGVINIILGSINLFIPDGGAESIAGIDISDSSEFIILLLAIIGLFLIIIGIIDLTIALRYRDFLPLVLGITTLQQLICFLIIWFIKPFNALTFVKIGVLVLLPIVIIGFILSFTRKKVEKEQHIRKFNYSLK